MGIFLTPDLDQQTKNRIENKLIKHPNPLIWLFGWLYIWFWYPYAISIKHRSPISHFPVLGTFGRLSYMAVGIGMLIYILPLLIGWIPVMMPEVIDMAVTHWNSYLPLIYGLLISDTLHWLFDQKWWKWLSGLFKKKSYRRTK